MCYCKSPGDGVCSRCQQLVDVGRLDGVIVADPEKDSEPCEVCGEMTDHFTTVSGDGGYRALCFHCRIPELWFIPIKTKACRPRQCGHDYYSGK